MSGEADGDWIVVGVDGARPLVAAVVEATARAADRDAGSLPPLYDTVDGEALACVCRESATPVTVSFRYAGRLVIVDGGEVRVSAGPVVESAGVELSGRDGGRGAEGAEGGVETPGGTCGGESESAGE